MPEPSRWVNAVVEIVIPLDDVTVQDTKLAKQAAAARVADRLADRLGPQLAEYVMVGRWEDMEADPPTDRSA